MTTLSAFPHPVPVLRCMFVPTFKPLSRYMSQDKPAVHVLAKEYVPAPMWRRYVVAGQRRVRQMYETCMTISPSTRPIVKVTATPHDVKRGTGHTFHLLMSLRHRVHTAHIHLHEPHLFPHPFFPVFHNPLQPFPLPPLRPPHPVSHACIRARATTSVCV